MLILRTIASLAAVSGVVVSLAGCSSIPRDGPTGSSVVKQSAATDRQTGYAIVDLDYASAQVIKAAPPMFLGSLTSTGPDDGAALPLGPGDVVSVSIFEPGGSLFGGPATLTAAPRLGAQTLPGLTISPAGAITVPFAGPVQIAGLSTTEAAAAIRRALIGKVANPQVIVTLAENGFNTVTVMGEIRQPGRASLTTNATHLIDAIAARGGPTRAVDDVVVSLRRAGQTYTAPLWVVNSKEDENIRLERGDIVNLIYKPRRFSTFGALGQVAQVEIPAGTITLTGALSRVGGLDTNSANARSVLVFRFERPGVARALGLTQPAQARGVPVVYRMDLTDPSSFFTGNEFEIQPDDLIYVPRSGSAEASKFFTLVQSLTRVVYDVTVTGLLDDN